MSDSTERFRTFANEFTVALNASDLPQTIKRMRGISERAGMEAYELWQAAGFPASLSTATFPCTCIDLAEKKSGTTGTPWVSEDPSDDVRIIFADVWDQIVRGIAQDRPERFEVEMRRVLARDEAWDTEPGEIENVTADAEGMTHYRSSEPRQLSVDAVRVFLGASAIACQVFAEHTIAARPVAANPEPTESRKPYPAESRALSLYRAVVERNPSLTKQAAIYAAASKLAKTGGNTLQKKDTWLRNARNAARKLGQAL